MSLHNVDLINIQEILWFGIMPFLIQYLADFLMAFDNTFFFYHLFVGSFGTKSPQLSHFVFAINLVP